MHIRALWRHFKPENRLAKIVRGFPCSVFLSRSTPSFLLTIAPHIIFRNIQSLVNFVLKINCAGRYSCTTKTYQRSEDSTKRNKCVLLLQPRPSLSEGLAHQPQSCSDPSFLPMWYPWTRSLPGKVGNVGSFPNLLDAPYHCSHQPTAVLGLPTLSWHGLIKPCELDSDHRPTLALYGLHNWRRVRRKNHNDHIDVAHLLINSSPFILSQETAGEKRASSMPFSWSNP